MKVRVLSLAAFIVASIFSLTSASAAPLTQVGKSDTMFEVLTTNSDIVKVKGCHKSRHRHWVPQWGKKTWHRHGYNCKPKYAGKKHHKKHHKKHYKKHNDGCFKLGPVWVCP